MICPPSRAAALGQFMAFMDRLPLYARDRNQVSPGHGAVSRLSPAIRHRLIDGAELVALALEQFPAGRIEKWIQEVYWRTYWKSWLEQRPQVWGDHDRRGSASWPREVLDLCHRIEAAESGNPIIDGFARELAETGYLHNHARMWVAAWWIHQQRLPWELGASWFFRRLLDGDPASNTLSWRWVAGLQTPGKTYLARRSNLEKYLDPAWLSSRMDGLSEFESPEALVPSAPQPCPLRELPEPVLTPDGAASSGLWIHEEDLSPETVLATDFQPQALAVSSHARAWGQAGFPETKTRWLNQAIDDAAARASRRWGLPVCRLPGLDPAAELGDWAARCGFDQVVTFRPPVGPLAREIPAISSSLQQCGVRLILLDRPADVWSRVHAAGGFFKFWERVRPVVCGER